MNDELFEYYSNLLIDSRAEQRFYPLLGLLNNLLELGYGERYLCQIYNMEIDNANDHIDAVEKMIISAFETEMLRMGVQINPDYAYTRPSSANYLLSAILEDIENHEDPERLYNFICGDNPGSYELESMLRAIYAEDSIELTELIVSMSPRFLVFIRNALEGKIEEENNASEDDLPFRQRVSMFIRRFPQNPEVVAFYNFDPNQDISILYDNLPYGIEGYTDYELCVIYTTGLSILASSTYDEAYGIAYEILERIMPPEELNELKVLGDVNEALFDIYDALSVGENDE